MERIHVDCFPWNLIIQEKVQSLKNCYQFLIDVEEAEYYNKTVINKPYLSKSIDLNIQKILNKEDKILFAGNFEGPQYAKRKETIRNPYDYL